MSRLDSAIRRLEAQKRTLEWAVGELAGRPGPILEFGLGNGRTYDHLREIAPGRDIYVFEREIAAHPDCVPPAGRVFIGDVADTIPAAVRALGPVAVLAHIDLGTGEKAASEALVGRIAPGLDRLLAPGAIVIADQPVASWPALAPPPGVAPGRIHVYRRGGIGPSGRGAKSVVPATSR